MMREEIIQTLQIKSEEIQQQLKKIEDFEKENRSNLCNQLLQPQIINIQQQNITVPQPITVSTFQQKQDLHLQFYNVQIELLQLQRIPFKEKSKSIITKKEIEVHQQQQQKQQDISLTQDQLYFNQLFYKVFHNIVIFKSIFNQVKLFKKNETVTFKSRNELVLYKEKEYICNLIYDCNEKLNVGDLSNSNGNLKTVEFGIIEITGHEIPFGVEKLEFKSFGYFLNKVEFPTWDTPFKNLPNSINTINGVIISNENTIIPPNITSITFNKCPCISNGNFIIPNTIKSLGLPNFNNDYVTLKPGDIPEGVTNLSTSYQFKDINSNILPSSIKELGISIIQKKYSQNVLDYLNNYFNFLPQNLETLKIYTNDSIMVTPLSKLSIFKYIKKLIIYSDKPYRGIRINPQSLPPNLTELSIINFNSDLDNVNILPNSITNLEIIFSSANGSVISPNLLSNNIKSLKLNHFIDKPNVFPSSLTHFHFIHNPYILADQKVENRKSNYLALKMVTLLPQSLTSIILPQSFKQYDLYIPPTIKVQYEVQKF